MDTFHQVCRARVVYKQKFCNIYVYIYIYVYKKGNRPIVMTEYVETACTCSMIY